MLNCLFWRNTELKRFIYMKWYVLLLFMQANFLKTWAGLTWILQSLGLSGLLAVEKCESLHPDLKATHFKGCESIITPDLQSLIKKIVFNPHGLIITRKFIMLYSLPIWTKKLLSCWKYSHLISNLQKYLDWSMF